MTTNNYILARWRDAITDPPPNGWKGHVSREERNGTVHQYCTEYMTNPHSFEFHGERRVFCAVRPGDQWLDITAIPGVPREAVQAAVNEIDAGLLRAETNACNGANTYFADGAIAAYKDALQEIEEHCGVAPEKEMGEE